MRMEKAVIEKTIRDYGVLKDIVSVLGEKAFREKYPNRYKPDGKNHGQAGQLEDFSVEGDRVVATFDTWCCGSYDSESVDFPLSEVEKEVGKYLFP